MTKLRSRLLVTLVLAAVALTTVGIEAAMARAPKRRTPSAWAQPSAVTRPGAGSFSGEPDPSGSGAPATDVKPASLTTAPGVWLSQMWLRWRTRNLVGPTHHPRSR